MSDKKAKKIMFTSGKGGVGKSTLSTTFSKLLVAGGDKVLIIDFDVSLRTLDIMLGVSTLVVYDWGDVIDDVCNSQTAIISKNGLDLLAAPNKSIKPTSDDIKRLISFYEDNYDYIILDCPAGVGEILDLTLSVADLAIVVSTPDFVCVHSASVAAEKINDAGVESRLLINKFKKNITSSGRALSVDDVIDATETQLIGIVPEDLYLSLSLLNGEMLDANLKSVKAMSRVVQRVKGKYIKLKI